MGEEFKRMRTKKFSEQADQDYQKKFAGQRLHLQRLGTYEASYRCEPAAQARSVVKQLSPKSVLMVTKEGSRWLVLTHNVVLGHIAQEGADDLDAKTSSADIAKGFVAELESVSQLGGNFKVRLRDEKEQTNRKTRKPKPSGKKHGN